MKSASREALPVLISSLLLVLVWWVISLFFLPIIFPGPLELAERVLDIYSQAESYAAVGNTLRAIFEGFAISMLVGTALGLLMGLKRDIEVFFDSWIMVLLTVPAVCWAFLSVLWFGLSEAAPVLTIVLIVFPFVVMNVWEGTKALGRDLSELAQVYRADRLLTLRKVVIPQLMPYLFSSLRLALSLSWKIALVAEAFGAGAGVGQHMVNAFQDTRVDLMLAWGLSFMVVMVLIDVFLFRLWARRVFAWRPQVAT
ncbi:MAG TPA: ABC transporter permease subunit [Burkholderiales bacterium]